MWEENKGPRPSLGIPQQMLRGTKSMHGLGTGAALQGAADLLPWHIQCQRSQLVPHQEVLKMALKFHPRNTTKCLFSLESEERHKAELFKVACFASKYIFLFKLVFSFVLSWYQFSKGALTLAPYLRFSDVYSAQWYPSGGYSTLRFFLFLCP